MRSDSRSLATVSRSARALPAAQDDLQMVEESVKAALMAPRNIVFPTVPTRRQCLWLVALTCAPEVLLTLGESGLLGFEQLRGVFLMYGAFWDGLLRGWEPIYPGQPVAMFFTYAALHGGLMHLVGNMVAVLALGRDCRCPDRRARFPAALCRQRVHRGDGLCAACRAPMRP